MGRVRSSVMGKGIGRDRGTGRNWRKCGVSDRSWVKGRGRVRCRSRIRCCKGVCRITVTCRSSRGVRDRVSVSCRGCSRDMSRCSCKLWLGVMVGVR